jgi:hypothetical protein
MSKPKANSIYSFKSLAPGIENSFNNYSLGPKQPTRPRFINFDSKSIGSRLSSVDPLSPRDVNMRLHNKRTSSQIGIFAPTVLKRERTE